ncbi:hypothetical protein Adt_40046 [Abeliophyllum distichum]|uniref:Uncharacterized protein n=1 Tax=Abeliophyllum distichum TaxID=126358 RepID=A0ABD1Q708_9LAMI
MLSRAADVEQDKCPRPFLAYLAGLKPRTLLLGSSEATVEEEGATVGDVEATEGEVPMKNKKKDAPSSQPRKKVVEIVDNYVVCNPPLLQRTLSVTPAREVILDAPPHKPQPSGGSQRS